MTTDAPPVDKEGHSLIKPYDRIPVFVRAGSIIPYAPPMQYVGEKPSDPITLYIYAGANGSFVLYEDQGTTFDYEKGAFSRFPFSGMTKQAPSRSANEQALMTECWTTAPSR